MRILITGADGILGSHLCDILNCSVFGISRKENSQHYVSDLTTFDPELKKAVDYIEPTHIIHAAAVQNHDPLCYQKNLLMTLAMVTHAKNHGSKFIFISSSTVYGDNGKEKICGIGDEAIEGTTEYANSKISGEIVAKSCGNYLIFRPCAMIDPAAKRGLCYDIANKIKDGSNQISLMGNSPGSIKPYISTQYAASYIASKINETNSIYNVAPHDNLSVKTIAETALKISGKNKAIVWAGAEINFLGDNPVVAMSSDINVPSMTFIKNYFEEVFS